MKMLAALLAVFLPGLLTAQVYKGQTLVEVSAAADTSAVVPGKPFRVAVTLKQAPGWHTYWQYSGDAGIPTTITWALPEGWAAGPIEWPVPRAILEPGDIQVYAYKGETTLLQTLIPPANLPAGQPIALTAKVAWLVCEEICIPGNAEVSLNLPVASEAGAAQPANAPLFAAAEARLPRADAPPFPVRWARDGDAWVGTVEAPAGTTEVTFAPLPAENQEVGHPAVTRAGDVFTIRLTANGGINGVLALTDAEGQRGWLVSTGEGEKAQGGGAGASPFENRKSKIENPPPLTWAQFWAAVGAGFLGGIILNLMPCVLPVISLKIFGFVRHAGESRRTIALHGVAFAAGIFAWFLGLAAVVVAVKAAGVEATWAFQFQNVWFNVVVATIVFAFALNLLGVFELALPGGAATALTNAGAREGYAGSFSQGVFATLLATPCTGPFLGSALGIAFTQAAPVTFALFASVAAGMALPYLLLSLQPAWVRHLPRPGGWMERLKQFMAFPLLATLLWLLYVIGNQRGPAAIIWVGAFLLLLGMALWIYGIVASPVVPAGRRLVGIAVAVALAAGGGWYFLGGHLAAETVPTAAGAGEGDAATTGAKDGIAWRPFSKAGLEKLLAEGKPVFVDFTADWCITCKFNERTAINVPAVRARFAELGIVPVKADWTNANPEITEALKAFGRVGVPFYLLYPAGRPTEPIVLPELLTEGIVLEALGKLGGASAGGE